MATIAQIRVFGTEYIPGRSGTIYAQVFDCECNPANTATVKLTLFKSDGTKILDDVTMTYVPLSNGIYGYDFDVPDEPAVYIADVHSTNPENFGTDEVHVAMPRALF